MPGSSSANTAAVRRPVGVAATRAVALGEMSSAGRSSLQKTSAGLDDDALVERARDDDRAAFEELVRRHAGRLYAIVVRFGADPAVAEEIVQEAFLRAWRGIAGFRRQAQFSTWLYRIGINETKRRLARDAARRDELSVDEPPFAGVPDWSRAPERRAEQHDLRTALERAVRALPEDYRAPLILRDIEGLSTHEAAAVMELGEAAFKSRLHRARLAVREALENQLDAEADE